MFNNVNYYLVLLFFVSTFNQLIAQPTIQDCAGAVSICEPIYVETTSPRGMGNVPDEIFSHRVGGWVCMADERNSIWYRFTVNNDGDFGFLIEPNDRFDDYDWALFDITTQDCSQLTIDPNMLVSCNAAGGGDCNGDTGANGNSNFNIQGGGCNNNTPDETSGFSAYNALIPVLEGNTYVLCISNWSSSTNGYTIDFGISGDIGIFDTESPTIVNAEIPDECGENEFILTFSENIECSTMDPDNFILQGPDGDHIINAITGGNCISGEGFENQFSLSINPPISEPGLYSFRIISPEDIFDLCGNQMSQNFNTDFNVTPNQFPTVDLGPDQTTCLGASLQLDANIADAASFLWQDGSNNPIYNANQSGTYVIAVTTDAGCVARDTIELIFEEDESFNFGPDILDCFGTSITIDPGVSNAVSYLWQDGSNNSTFTTTAAGAYAVEMQLDNDCITRDTIQVILERDFSLNLGNDTAVCSFSPFTIDASNFTGDFEWQDGSSSSTFTISNPGLYYLNIREADGCLLSDSIIVTAFSDNQSFSLGRDTTICIGTSALYDLNFLNGVSYIWEDGSDQNIREINQEGMFSVTVESEDCTTYTSSVTIALTDCNPCNVFLPNIFTPNGDNINDVFKAEIDCNLSNFQLAVYDRWGSKVFETNDPNEGWNGRVGQKRGGIGVFVWVMSYDQNGSTTLRKGDIALIN